MWGEHFEIFGCVFQTMGSFIAISFLVAGGYFYRMCCRFNWSITQFFFVFASVVISAPAGAAILSAIEYHTQIFAVLAGKSGSSHIGGFLLAIPSLFFVARWQNLPSLKLFDVCVLGWCAAHTIGRFACFFAGDGCYGIPTSSWIGMKFPNGIVPSFIAVYPTPLFESAYSLIIFSVFYYLYVRKRAKPYTEGRVFFGVASWMLLCRFAIEFIRRNPKYSGLSLTQWICIPCVVGFSIANMFVAPTKLSK